MNKLMSIVAALTVSLSLSSAVMAAHVPGHDHTTSDAIAKEADKAGKMAAEGLGQATEVFTVTGKIVFGGAAFLILEGMRGAVWVAEESVAGLKYCVKGAKLIIIKTAQGIRWVAVKALELGEVVIEGIKEATRWVVEKTVFIAIKVADGVAIVMEEAVKAGKLVIRGVKYVAIKTKEGIVYVAEATAAALKDTYQWAREQTLRVNIRTRLASAMLASGASAGTLDFFKAQATNAYSSESLKRLANAALNACQAFATAYAQ